MQLIKLWQLLKDWLKPADIVPDEVDVLHQSIRNALLVVMTASENAIALEPKTIATVIAAKNALTTGEISQELESEFWNAYRILTQTIRPATIDSIRATHEPSKGIATALFSRKGKPLSRRCATNYKVISLTTLCLLIAIQIYWYVGWSLMHDIDVQSLQINQMSEELVSLKLQKSSTKINDATKHIQTARIADLQEEIAVHINRRNAAFYHLQNWNETWSQLDLITLQPWQEPQFATYPLQVQRHIEFVAARNFLAAVMNYVLPILYGMIGACFFILRQLPKEISSRTFSMTSYIGYSLRMAQGPLAGILISYFFAPEQIDAKQLSVAENDLSPLDLSVITLSPLAVAFLAGYSVEFIFRFIDKALLLSGPDEPAAKPEKNIPKERKTTS